MSSRVPHIRPWTGFVRGFCRTSFIAVAVSVAAAMASCTAVRHASKAVSSASVDMSLPSDEEIEERRDEIVSKVVVDSTEHSGPVIMNAIRDEETGEMVATDVISASKVTARFRHVAERFGKVSIEFDVNVPSALLDSKWQLRFYPSMQIQQDTVALEPIYLTGSRYRGAQLRGYQRYQAFLSSIITDTTDFVRIRQLEIFLERNFPETYSMKTDTTLISDPEAESLFGVTQRDALEHYTDHLLQDRNARRARRSEAMYRRCVKDPIVTAGIRLDTVLADGNGGITYRYVQEFQSRPGLKKVVVSMKGSLYDYGHRIADVPAPEDLTFYVSSLSTLCDPTVRYVTRIIERNAYDRTLALIDFAQGKSDIDTTLGCNASELRRIRKIVDDVFSDEEFEVDSMIVTASCSPEGSFGKNARLASERARSVRHFVDISEGECDTLTKDRAVPENWALLDRLVSSDSTLSEARKSALLAIIRGGKDPDRREAVLARTPEYRYLREKLYPRLRTVQLEFHTHRRGMVKDTIHTTIPDTVYMAGVEALRNLDYKKAAEALRPYRDYNSALAFVALSYNNTALDILDGLPQNDSKVLYLKAIALSRLSRTSEAMDCWKRSVELDPAMLYRANLDPELSELTRHTFNQ